MFNSWHELQNEAIASTPAYPAEDFSGRGIVICAGGARLFTCAWLLLKVLRELVHSELPVEVWHLGPQEIDWRMAELLQEFGAKVIDAWKVDAGEWQPAQGWTLKPFAIQHSAFEEVLLLDADNLAVGDPAELFEHPEYQRTGAIFWPDLDPLPPENPIWDICHVPYRDEPSFESGQLLTHKQRCWQALHLTAHLNQQSDFYYQHLHGDKDTFHMAWRMLGQPYSMIPYPIACLLTPMVPGSKYRGPVLQQHDFEGRVLFQHRNGPKWVAGGENALYPDLIYEKECLQFLQGLERRWDGRVHSALPTLPKIESPDREMDPSVWFLYERVYSDQRYLEFCSDGRIATGGSGAEQRWEIVEESGEAVLKIHGKDGLTCRLSRVSPGSWRGKWIHYEKLQVELTRWDPPGMHRLNLFGSFRGMTGHDHHVREFARELDRRGIDVRLLDLPSWSPARLPEDLQEEWFNHRQADSMDGPVVQFCMPHQVLALPQSRIINFTMFEANRAPADWVARGKTHDLVILPTESSRQAWIEAGMPADRIRLCPLGVNPVVYGAPLAAGPFPGSEFAIRFLNISAYGPRKNLAGLLRAWKKATSPTDDAVLFLKVGCHEPASQQAFQRDLEAASGAAPIHVIQDALSDQEMPGLYAAATHYISMSHGEGWDLPMMEAGAAGLKLIAPKHSAYLSYLDDNIATLLPSREVPVVWTGDPATGELFRGANWWEPDEDAAVEAIRAAIEDRKETARARERILRDFTWQKATEQLLRILSDVNSGEARRWLWWLSPRRGDALGA